MAKRDILIIPDKRLRLKSEPVAEDRQVGARAGRRHVRDHVRGARHRARRHPDRRAAKRVVTMDLAKKDEPKAPQVFINPEVTWISDEKAIYEEGCLSIPEYYEEVERPNAVKVKFLDLDGKPQELEASGLLRHLPAARDRPHQRRVVHRPHFQAQARHGAQEVQEGAKARRGRHHRAEGRHARASFRLGSARSLKPANGALTGPACRCA